MATVLRFLVLLPIAVLTVVLAMANRGPVTLSLDPTGGDLGLATLALPLFVVVLAAIMLGIVIGGIACWFGQGKYRKAARVSRREAKELKQETERLRLMVPVSASLPGTSN